MENPIIIIGANALGKAVLDIFNQNGVVVYCFLDDHEVLHNTEIADVSILGFSDDEAFLSLIGKKCEYFIASDDNSEKEVLAQSIIKNYKQKAVNAIHSKAIISETSAIGHGNLIDAAAVIKSFATIGDSCNINSGAIVGVNAQIGNFVQIGYNSIISENVIIEDNVFIGAGVTIVAGVKIGKNSRIGAGSVVVTAIPKNQTVFGNPAKTI